LIVDVPFPPNGLSSGNDPDYAPSLMIGMDDDQNSQLGAKPEKNETVFLRRMLRVIEQ
jgi:hypothetical protein